MKANIYNGLVQLKKYRFPLELPLSATQLFERSLIEFVQRLFTNIVKWRELNKGGHFVALEEPQLVSEMIHDFFSELK
jgi:hypothetical protein